MLENLDLRDDERLWLNKHYYGLKQKIDIAEEDTLAMKKTPMRLKPTMKSPMNADTEANEESSYEKKRRLRILANRKKIQELSSLFK